MSGVSSSSKLKLSLLLPCRSVYIRLFSLHTHLDIEPKNQKKGKKFLESSFFSRNGFHLTKYEILLSNVPFMWTCENLKSLLFHILIEHLNNLWRDFQFEIFSLLMYLFISCFTKHRFCDTFCAGNASKGLWRFNGAFLSLSIHPRRCEWLSPQFPLCGTNCVFVAWLWRLSTVNYESILQGKLIQYWWLAHIIGNLCPDDLSHWVGDSAISDCTDCLSCISVWKLTQHCLRWRWQQLDRCTYFNTTPG